MKSGILSSNGLELFGSWLVLSLQYFRIPREISKFDLTNLVFHLPIYPAFDRCAIRLFRPPALSNHG